MQPASVGAIGPAAYRTRARDHPDHSPAHRLAPQDAARARRCRSTFRLPGSPAIRSVSNGVAAVHRPWSRLSRAFGDSSSFADPRRFHIFAPRLAEQAAAPFQSGKANHTGQRRRNVFPAHRHPCCALGGRDLLGPAPHLRDFTTKFSSSMNGAPFAGGRFPLVYTKPLVKRQKNDAADAEAICEAALRPAMLCPTGDAGIAERALRAGEERGDAGRGEPAIGREGVAAQDDTEQSVATVAKPDRRNHPPTAHRRAGGGDLEPDPQTPYGRGDHANRILKPDLSAPADAPGSALISPSRKRWLHMSQRAPRVHVAQAELAASAGR